jgi:D-xylose transport system permease protein
VSEIHSSNPDTNTAAETIAVESASSSHHSPMGGEPPPVIATGYEGSVGDQVRAQLARIRGGEMGMLPALAGLLVLSILFGFLSPFFFTKGNVANLMTQTAALMMLSIALTFVIILTEIDLSAGITGGVGMAVFIILVNTNGWNWVLAFVIALGVGAVIGTVLGWFVAKVGIPSFVVSLGLFLAFQGLMLVLLGDGGTYQVQTPDVVAIMNKSMAPWLGWLMLAVIVLVSLGTGLYDRMRRLAEGMPVRPMSLLLVRVVAWVVVGGFMVFLLNQNRARGPIPI